jgi:hypothetical protein
MSFHGTAACCRRASFETLFAASPMTSRLRITASWTTSELENPRFPPRVARAIRSILSRMSAIRAWSLKAGPPRRGSEDGSASGEILPAPRRPCDGGSLRARSTALLGREGTLIHRDRPVGQRRWSEWPPSGVPTRRRECAGSLWRSPRISLHRGEVRPPPRFRAHAPR